MRPDFWELVDYATAHHVGVKFSTNGSDHPRGGHAAGSHRLRRRSDLTRRRRPRSTTPSGGTGSFDMAVRALQNLAAAGFAGVKISVVITRRNAAQLDEFATLASRYGATLGG